VHEYAVTKNIFDIVMREAENNKASKVQKVRIVIGDMSAIIADSVSMYFELFSTDTIAQDAILEFVRVPAELYCKNCDKNFEKPKKGFLCPDCCIDGTLTNRGKEFYVESIVLD
jgi:hydrogenase nickel incorporation protein HypA/HybF